MSQPKAATTTADTDWLKIKSWAAQQKIPTTAVNNVEQLDQQRITSGEYPMSNAERTRAILAAAGQNYSTALPSDAPKASNVIGNTISDVKSIATGLMPTRLGSNIADTAKKTWQAVEDPSKLKGSSPGKTLGNYLTDTALSWVPGAADIGTVLEADPKLQNGKGFEALAQHPLTSLLDVMPGLKAVDSAAGSVAAKTAVGDALAQKLSIEPKALGQMGGVRMAGKAIGQIKVGRAKGFVTDADGNEILARKTVSQRMEDSALKLGTGKLLAKSAHVMTEGNNQATIVYRDGMIAYNQAMEDLPVEQVPKLTEVMHSGLSADDMVNDPDLTPEQKGVVEAYRPMEQQHLQQELETGRLIDTKLPDGTSGYYIKTSPVHELIRRADEAHARADEASARSDAIQETQKQLDQAASPVMQKITETKDMIAGMANMLAEQSATVNAGWLKMFGRLTGKGGLLEQMQDALNEGDYNRLRIATRSARKVLANKTMGDINQVSHMADLKANVDRMYDYAGLRQKTIRDYDKAYHGKTKSSKGSSARELNRRAERTTKKVMAHVRAHPPDEYRDLVLQKFFENFTKSANAEEILDNAAAGLKATDHDPDIVDKLREDPRKLYELIVATSDPTFRDPFLPNMTPQDHAIFMNDALKEVDSLRARGYKPMWVPTVGAVSAAGDLVGDDRIYAGALKNPTIDAAKRKAYDMSNTVNDLSMGVSRMMKQPLERDVTLHHATEIVKPMLKPLTALKRAVAKEHIGEITDEYAATAGASITSYITGDYNMAKVDLQRVYGIKNSDIGLDDDEDYYMQKDLYRQIEIQFGRDQFPLKGSWDKITGVFKYSILAFSPRYTAHVAFGGSMLLALREPEGFLQIGKAFREVQKYHRGDRTGEIPGEVMQGAAQFGTPDTQFHFRGGTSMGVGAIQAKLAEWGIDHKVATGVQWAKAAGQVNFRFTNYIGDMQRSMSYLSGLKRATRKGYYLDPVTGEEMAMTEDRAHFEGMQAAERVMGNLQAMTPLERGVARKIMPFYGWTKHILKYVLTYPVDHPWRTMFLSTLASQNSERFSSGLDERMQLLFFLGSPDPAGNVSAVDVRQLDPFRDVANYATLGGWISSMNPIITAPFAAVDPQIIYGGNVLHPSISYDSFYGTNTAGAEGGGLSAAEQEIPELSAVDQALGMSANARSIKKSGGSSKAILNAVGVPWVPQKLNLQQISAKHEVDRYNQAAADALDAWQSGDFSKLKQYPSDAQLPDPLNKAYNITPAQLEKLYQAALKANPSAPPSETVPDLVSPSL